MANMQIKINGRDYQLACDDGQEEQLRLLADEVDDRLRALVFSMGSNPGTEMALILTALTMADEATENKKEIETLSAELRRVTAHLNKQTQLNSEHKQQVQEQRLSEMEAAMAVTLEDIAQRIEKIAEQIEIR